MAYQEIRPQQQSRRDRNLQRRGIETPEVREKKEIRKAKAEQGIGNAGGCLSVLDAQ